MRARQRLGVGGRDPEHVAADRRRVSVRRRAERDQPALVEDRDAIAERRLVHQVRREHDRRAVAIAQRRELVPQVASRAAGRAPCWPRRARAPAVASAGPWPVRRAAAGRPRACRAIARARSAQADAVERPRACRCRSSRPVQAVEVPVAPEVLADRQLRVDGGRLEHHAERAPHVARRASRTSCPKTRTVPVRGRQQRASRIRNSVVLPPPFGPSSAKISPACTVEAHVAQRVAVAVAVRQRVDGEAAGMAAAIGGAPLRRA